LTRSRLFAYTVVMTTYYDILGVPSSATPDEIKSAYRKLAMQWHPDRNQDNAEATAKFKDINAAYETLIDNNKRREYDFQQQHGNQTGPDVGGMHWNVNFNGHPFGPGGLDDFVSQIFGQHGFGHFRQPPRNRDVNLSMQISLEDAYNGRQTPINFSTPSGRRVELVIDIPRGIDTGTRIRYTGQGDHDNSSMPPGDLYISVVIADHHIFSRNGNNLECVAKIDAISAIIGTKYKLTSINGSEISISIPAGTQPGTRLRISGAGMPFRGKTDTFGDLILKVEISIPNKLTDEILQQLQSIQKTRGVDNL